MYCASGFYPRTEGGTFNFDYYAKKHIPMVVALLGRNAIRSEVRKGVAAADGSPAPYVCVGSVWVHSIDEFLATLARHGPQIMGDVPNYTNIPPVLQVEEVVT
jgi:uncharacterized protein (TIGR02118 family)